MILTFYNEAIDQRIVKAQKKVFDYFKLPLQQIKPEVWMNHSGSIDYFIKNYKGDWNYIVLFDIDCIPLNADVVPDSIKWATNNTGLYSVAQNANHIPNSPDYASPAFLVFSKKTYDLLGQPSFVATNRSDCAGELTYKARELGVEIKLMYPTKVDVPKWKLHNGQMFGIGTNYENKIYHYFEARKNRVEGFVNTCEKIIKI